MNNNLKKFVSFLSLHTLRSFQDIFREIVCPPSPTYSHHSPFSNTAYTLVMSRPAPDSDDDADDVGGRFSFGKGGGGGGAGGAAEEQQRKQSSLCGDELKEAAEMKLDSGWFVNLFKSGNKYEDAVELYHRAAAQYKLSGHWLEAGRMYTVCAEITNKHLLHLTLLQVATEWQDAAKAFQKVDTKQAIGCFTHAAEIYMDHNKFSLAGKTWKEIAMVQEKAHDIFSAMASFKKAMDCYVADNAISHGNAMHLKVADLAMTLGMYVAAISIYEQVSTMSLEEGAHSWSVKDHLFRAILCHFAQTATSPSHKVHDVRVKLATYVDMCPKLDNTREQHLVQDLLTAFENQDVDQFAAHVFVFDEMTRLEPWGVKVLLAIKTALENENPEAQQVGV